MRKYFIKINSHLKYNICLITVLLALIFLFYGCSNVIRLGTIDANGRVREIRAGNYKVKIGIKEITNFLNETINRDSIKTKYYIYSISLLSKDENRLNKDAKCRVIIRKQTGSIRLHTGRRRLLKEFVEEINPRFNDDKGNHEFEYQYNSDDRYEIEIMLNNLPEKNEGEELIIKFINDV